MKIENLFELLSFPGADLIDLHNNMKDQGVWEYDEESDQTRYEYLEELGYTEEQADVVEALFNHAYGYVPSTIVSGDKFTDYAREHATDCGYVDNNNPLVEYVDWEAYAENMKQDFTEVEVGIHIFYVSDN